MAKIKFENVEHARQYVSNLPIQTIIDDYAQLLWETQNFEPIKITEAQLKTVFKIVGFTKEGELERRGRKPKQI